MRVIVTRPLPDADRTADALRAAGHVPLLSPVLAIRPTGRSLPEGAFDAVVVTSAHALPPVTAPLPAGLLSLPLHAVGATTAAAARDAGFRDVRTGPGSGEDLASALAASLSPGARLLYLAGRERTPGLEAVLAAAGLAPVIADVYAAEAVTALSEAARRALGAGGPLAVLHFSRRSAALFLSQLEAAGLVEATRDALLHCCLSEAVAWPLRQRGLAPLVATKPRADALIRLLPC